MREERRGGGRVGHRNGQPRWARWLFLAALVAAAVRLSGRSGVTDDEVALALPGDELLPDPAWVVDRATTLDAPPERVWPWLVQLGRRRGGWYMPAWAEDRLPPGWRGARELIPAFGAVAVGDVIPDYGPEPAFFQALHVAPNRALAYVSFRGGGLTLEDWPPVGGWRDDAMGLVWALVLTPVDGGRRTRFHVRLRSNRPAAGSPWAWPVRIGGGLFDWLTIELLFRGLAERVRG